MTDAPHDILAAMFPDGVSVTSDGAVFSGEGKIDGGAVHVIGTAGAAYIGTEIAHALTACVLKVMQEHPGETIAMLVDNAGQRLSKRDELLGNNAFLANLAKALEVASRRGHTVVSLVYGRAVSGGFLATGMSADTCIALENAEIGVMGLDAMSRVTKVARARLEQLCADSAIFGPGVKNFHALGVIDEILGSPGDFPDFLKRIKGRQRDAARRRRDGFERSGRTTAKTVSESVRQAP